MRQLYSVLFVLSLDGASIPYLPQSKKYPKTRIEDLELPQERNSWAQGVGRRYAEERRNTPKYPCFPLNVRLLLAWKEYFVNPLLSDLACLGLVLVQVGRQQHFSFFIIG